MRYAWSSSRISLRGVERMRRNTALFWRLVSYFRLGYSYYISFPLAIFNFMMIAYYLMMERIPILRAIFPSFLAFILLSSLGLAPASIALGYFHARRSTAMAMDSYVAARANPLIIVPNAISMRQSLQMYRHLNVPVDPEFLKLVAFYEKEEQKQSWRP